MKNKNIVKWKYIVIYDELKEKCTKYELNEDERLLNKMKRQKKRSFLHPQIISAMESTNNARKYDFQYKVIFSYFNKFSNVPQTAVSPPNFPFPSQPVACPINHIQLPLPSLVKPVTNNEQNESKKIILITDISTDDIDTKK